jgi:hypothetical protein
MDGRILLEGRADNARLRISVHCFRTREESGVQLSADVARQEKSLRVCDVRHCLVLGSVDELSRVTLAEFSEDCEDGMSRTELFFRSAEILTAELP